MKTLTSLIVGGALALGTAMAQDAPKTATPAAPAAQTQGKTKAAKHRKHKKAVKPAAASDATPAPNTTAPKK